MTVWGKRGQNWDGRGWSNAALKVTLMASAFSNPLASELESLPAPMAAQEAKCGTAQGNEKNK